MSNRSRYGIPEDDDAAERFVQELMSHRVPRTHTKTHKPPRTKASPPKCPVCRRWLAPGISHSLCLEAS